MKPLNVYNIGEKGVNVDSSPIHTEDGELTRAQNVEHNKSGARGGVVNRPGLAKHNDDDLGSLVLGGFTMSYPDNSQVETATFWWAQQTSGGANVWYRSNDLYASSLTWVLVDPPSAWQADPPVAFATLRHYTRMVEHKGRIYYPGTHTSGTTAPTIRVFNGKDDYQLAKILPETTAWIHLMKVSRGRIFILTLDSGVDDTSWVSRVFELDPETGYVTQIGAALDTGYYATALEVHNNDLYVGASRVTEGNVGRVYRIRLDIATAWTTEVNMAAERNNITELTSFKGLLYVTTGSNDSNGTNKGAVLRQTALGAWAVVDTAVVPTRGGLFQAMTIFEGKLYTLGIAFTGGNLLRSSSDGTTWVTDANSPDDFPDNASSVLKVVGRRLFLHGAGGTSEFAHTTTPTGTWTTGIGPGETGGGGSGTGSTLMTLRP